MEARILVVDDDKQVREYLSNMLGNVGGFSVEAAVEAMERGASDYLTKPFDLDDTLARLRRVLLDKKRFLTIKNHPHGCSFGWEKIKEMKENQIEFWAGDGFTRLRIVGVNERDETIYMIP